MLLWYAEYSDKAVLETARGKSFCINKIIGICYRQCLWLQPVAMDGSRSSEAAGKGELQLT